MLIIITKKKIKKIINMISGERIVFVNKKLTKTRRAEIQAYNKGLEKSIEIIKNIFQ